VPPSRRRRFLQFLVLSRPHFLAGGFLLFGLGAAMAHAFGADIKLSTYLLGQAIVTCLQLMTHYYNEYYDVEGDITNPNRTLFSGGSGALGGEEGLPTRLAQQAGSAAMLAGALLAGFMIATGMMPLAAALILSLGAAGSFLYSVPPVRLVSSGYGEFTTAVVVAGLVPAFAFSLQTGGFDFRLVLTTFPLVAVTFAMLLVFELPDYGADVAAGKQTLMVRIGWRRAMWLHDIALLAAFLELGLAYAMGVPRQVVLGSLIALPLAIAQVFTLWRIRRGFPPKWKILTTSAIGVLGLLAYLELAGFLLS
jgi:1,4-dihydroxy-2-naphthoate polyprenyltransferase